MLYVPIKDTRPGMVVAKPVCQARNRVYFVQKGFPLDLRTIARLTELGVQNLWVEFAGLEEVDNRINERIVENRQDLDVVLTNALDKLRGRTDAVVDCRQFESRVGSLLSQILDDPSHEPIMANLTGDCGAMVRHLTNCCYVSMLIGTHLSGYVRNQRRKMPEHIAQDVRQLGLGAFVHDLGKTQLSDEVREIHALHPRANEREYLSHVKVGCEMLRGQLPPLVVYLVAHHHQRFDGTGFPKIQPRNPGGGPAGLKGEKIHIFARILTVANTFDRLLGTPQRPRLTIQALHAMQQPTLASWFDPVVLAALNRLVPPFMAGSLVTLSDGRQAVVVENHSDAPCSPSVREIMGEPGAPEAAVGEETIDLRTEPCLEVGMVDGIDVRPYYFVPESISEGVMAYWGLRNKAVSAMNIDPASFVAEGA